jgi:hypothetical protein
MTQVLNRSPRAGVTGYVVRAGTIPRVGAEEVLGPFATEGEAREAFLALRLSPAYRQGWAELVAVGEGRAPMPLCWFDDRSPSGTPANPFHPKRPLKTQSRAVLVDNPGGTMQTKELERSAAVAPDPDRQRRIRRTRAVAALVAVLAATGLAIGAAAGNNGESAPSDRPVSTWQVEPSQPTDLPYYGAPADG